MKIFIILPLLFSLAGGDSDNPLLFSLSTDRSVYRPGENAIIKLRLENRGDKTLELTFPSAQRCDILITRDGNEVWRWSHDKAFAMAITTLKTRPGEVLSFREKWDQRDNMGNRVGIGIYGIRGILKTKGEIYTNTVNIEIREK